MKLHSVKYNKIVWYLCILYLTGWWWWVTVCYRILLLCENIFYVQFQVTVLIVLKFNMVKFLLTYLVFWMSNLRPFKKVDLRCAYCLRILSIVPRIFIWLDSPVWCSSVDIDLTWQSSETSYAQIDFWLSIDMKILMSSNFLWRLAGRSWMREVEDRSKWRAIGEDHCWRYSSSSGLLWADDDDV